MQIRLAWAQPGVRQQREGFGHAVDEKTQVVQSFAVSGEMLLKRVFRRERLDELQVDVAEIEMCQPHLGVVHNLAQQDGQTEHITIKAEGFLGIPYNNRNMVEPVKHGLRMQQHWVWLKAAPLAVFFFARTVVFILVSLLPQVGTELAGHALAGVITTTGRSRVSFTP